MKPDELIPNRPTSHSMSPALDQERDPERPPEFAAAAQNASPVGEATAPPTGGAPGAQPPSTKRRRKARRVRPGWKATLVRVPTFQQLRAIQKSSIGLGFDLGYLSDACIALALELGAQRIVERALLGLRTETPADPGSLESATSPSSPSQLASE